MTEPISAVRGKWWVVVLLGVVVAVLGVLLLANLVVALTTLAVYVAIGLLVVGIDEIVGAERYHKRWPAYVLGALWIAFGLVALFWPGITLLALALTVGISFVAGGAIQAGMALAWRRELPAWGLWLTVGLLTLVVGLIALAWPDLTVLTLAIWLGVALLVRGLTVIWFGLRLRNVAALV
ncbi:HdeD family acid-resistance protein [Actinokineospora sp. HUAS TT18]|uniref:HdeD family acid-resistance protein n=1 Tax=Actinokineospora sp. HUAS TT18 TaxID=3447451 RepID=UPI003F522D70